MIGGSHGGNAGLKQAFVGINIAHAHHHGVVHQRKLGRALLFAQLFVKIIGIKLRRERLGAERGEQRVVLGCAGKPQYGTEAARVVQAQHGAVGKHDIHMVVFVGRGNAGIAGGKNAQAARHAQVNQHNAGGKTNQQIFGTARAFEHRLACQGVCQIIGNAPAQLGLANNGIGNGLAVDVRADAAQGGFDFGQFGHGFSLVAGVWR